MTDINNAHTVQRREALIAGAAASTPFLGCRTSAANSGNDNYINLIELTIYNKLDKSNINKKLIVMSKCINKGYDIDNRSGGGRMTIYSQSMPSEKVSTLQSSNSVVFSNGKFYTDNEIHLGNSLTLIPTTGLGPGYMPANGILLDEEYHEPGVKLSWNKQNSKNRIEIEDISEHLKPGQILVHKFSPKATFAKTERLYGTLDGKSTMGKLSTGHKIERGIAEISLTPKVVVKHHGRLKVNTISGKR